MVPTGAARAAAERRDGPWLGRPRRALAAVGSAALLLMAVLWMQQRVVREWYAGEAPVQVQREPCPVVAAAGADLEAETAALHLMMRGKGNFTCDCSLESKAQTFSIQLKACGEREFVLRSRLPAGTPPLGLEREGEPEPVKADQAAIIPSGSC
jgi:hypothetical protein